MRLRLYILIFLLAVILIPFRAVFGGESAFEGEVTAKGQLVDVNGNEAKFNEYGDTKDGIYGNIGLNYEREKYFLKFNADDIGYDTQKYMIEGGMWGKFKYNMYYMEIPHNITFDARTFLSGAGRDKLTGTPNSDVSTWHKFDYSTERKRYGAGLKFDMLNPFFIDAEVQREEKSGIKAAGGQFSMEVPEPVDYTTDTFSVEAGYNKKPFFASLNYFYSKFDNDNQSLTVSTPSPLAITLPADNDYHRIGFKGSVMLPFNSRFSTNIGIAEAKSDYKLVDEEGNACTTTCSNQTFDGKIKSKNYDFVLTSNPVSFLDGKIYYKYYRDKNKSDEILDTVIGESNELLSYKKTSYGTQLGFRLPQNIKLTAKYAHMDTNYDNRIDVNKRKDDTYGIDLGWTGLDFLTVNAGYERMNRRTDRPGVDPDEAIEKYLGRFDVSPFNRDTYKVSCEVNPLEDLDISLGYKYKKTDYNDTGIGLREDKRDEYNIAANYAAGKMVKIFGYFDYEKVRAKQFHRVYDLGNENPSLPQDVNNYNWDVKHEEVNYDYGIGSDIYAIPGKLTLTLQYDNVKSDGNADFTYHLPNDEIPGGATNSSIDISNSDDYRKQAVSVKAVYNVSKPLTVTGGYAYEQYKYSDAQLDGYKYDAPLYLTGAFKDSSYNANVVFVTAVYKF
ncbi:MAG: MtrB/PioB family outer membrane beta-barrel protein [Nitrospirae bacterium]|nr:MtrB/PioB family outer membrane beta-barrel protein [Nitrospirota bacterium]